MFLAATGEMPAAQAFELASMLSGLAERTQQYYDRFISIICTETVYQQDLRSNLSPVGKPRMTVYELSVAHASGSTDGAKFRVERLLQMVNGRPASRNQEPGCTDPKTGTPEPLEFLLAQNQKRYRFSVADAAGGPAGSRAIDFVQSPPERVRITWKGSCFNAEGGGHRGRVWFDPETFDILQVDVRLANPFLVPLPAGSFGPQPAVRVERWEGTLRFASVKFTQPDETVLLPESIETLSVFRGAPSHRTSQKLTNFRRFLSESTIRSATF
jgi:hypothetical protein